jgi:ferrochelatase
MAKKAILLLNLGSPKSPSTKDVRTYLNEFLMDGKVIDVPYLLRLLLVKGIITRFRAPKSAELYRSIWTDEGSPLVVITEKLTKQVEDFTGYPTYFSMRYATDAPQDVMNRIYEEHPDLEEVVLLPLYPHYAMSSYETGVEYAVKAHKEGGFKFDLLIIPPYYNKGHYIDALCEIIDPFVSKEYDHIVFSYHGIPERHVKKTDCTKAHCLKVENCCSVESEAHKYCYRHQVIETTELVASKLSIPSHKYSFAFQSRLGADAWLKPYTAKRLEEMPKEGIKNLLVVCPAFVSDCLETLEEMHEEGKEIFMEAGGESFEVIPCLNNEMSWVKSIGELIAEPV